MPPLSKCDHCHFWCPDKIDIDVGLCRRFPPVPVLSAEGDDDPFFTRCPVTTGNDWCGEFINRDAGDVPN